MKELRRHKGMCKIRTATGNLAVERSYNKMRSGSKLVEWENEIYFLSSFALACPTLCKMSTSPPRIRLWPWSVVLTVIKKNQEGIYWKLERIMGKNPVKRLNYKEAIIWDEEEEKPDLRKVIDDF